MARLFGDIFRTLASRDLRAVSSALMASLYVLATVGLFVAVAFFAGVGFVVDVVVAVFLAGAFLLGAARDVDSEAEESASESMSMAEYWRFVAALLGGMFAWTIGRSKVELKKRRCRGGKARGSQVLALGRRLGSIRETATRRHHLKKYNSEKRNRS